MSSSSPRGAVSPTWPERSPNLPLERRGHLVDFGLVRVSWDEGLGTVGNPHRRKGLGHEEPVPTSDSPSGSDSHPHRNEWKAGHTCDCQHAELQLPVGAAGAVGRNGKILIPYEPL